MGWASAWLVAAVLAGVLATAPGPAGAAVERAGTWYVRAGAAPGGDGSRRAPFDTLARVEEASRPGDRITVLRAAATAPPLDGGIELKARQRLIGAGPRVTRASARGPAPRLTNTDPARLDGDAVRLASGATVRNLVITGAAARRCLRHQRERRANRRQRHLRP